MALQQIGNVLIDSSFKCTRTRTRTHTIYQKEQHLHCMTIQTLGNKVSHGKEVQIYP